MNDILLYFTIKYKGNWESIYSALVAKEEILDKELKKIPQKIKNKYISIIDKNYPENLKKIYKPPFSLFWSGNVNLLNNEIISLASNNTDDLKKQLSELKKIENVSYMVDSENKYLIDIMISNNFKIIINSKRNIEHIKNDPFYKKNIYNDHLFISEVPYNNENNEIEQNNLRIFLGLSRRILFLSKPFDSQFQPIKNICKIEHFEMFSTFDGNDLKNINGKYDLIFKSKYS